APTESDVVASILQKKPLFEWRFPNVPPKLSWILEKALAKEKEERYQTAKDLLIDLRRLKRELEFDAEMGGFEPLDTSAAGKSISVSARSIESGKKTSRASSGSARRSSSAGRKRSRAAINSLAVIPLVNAGGDPGAE